MATATSGTREAIDPLSDFVNPLSKLLKHQEHEKQVTLHKLKQIIKFKEDYEILHKKLSNITDKVTHEVMVPLGPMAFFPGKLKHTNEVMVLLGDNLFVERSAKQAAEIVQRRIDHCEGVARKFCGELKLLDGWKNQAHQLHEDMSDEAKANIKEHQSEEEYQRTKKVRAPPPKSERVVPKLTSRKEPEESGNDFDEWSRLDELELLEELKDEMSKNDGDFDDEGYDFGERIFDQEEPGESSQDEDEDEDEDEVDEDHDDDGNQVAVKGRVMERETVPRSRKVTWNEEDSVRQFNKDEILSKNDPSSLSDGSEALKITFKHTTESSAKPKHPLPTAPATAVNPSSVAVVPASPSDIFRQFVADIPEPKSILKVKKSTTPTVTLPIEDKDDQTKQQQTAVSDVVKERTFDAVQPPAQAVNTHRPVSRFRSARLSNTNKL